MRLQIIFKQPNLDFDQQYANEFQGGKESDGNWKDLWSVTHEFEEEVDDIRVIKEDNFQIDGEILQGQRVSLTLPKMKIIECIRNEKVIYKAAVSNDLVLKPQKSPDRKHNVIRFYYYFNARTDFVKLGSLVYILKKDFPKELLPFVKKKSAKV
jgi:hypothetical protein